MSLITEYSECLFITDSFYVRWLRSNYHNEVRESDSNDMTFGAQTIVDSVKIAAEVWLVMVTRKISRHQIDWIFNVGAYNIISPNFKETIITEYSDSVLSLFLTYEFYSKWLSELPQHQTNITLLHQKVANIVRRSHSLQHYFYRYCNLYLHCFTTFPVTCNIVHLVHKDFVIDFAIICYKTSRIARNINIYNFGKRRTVFLNL